MIHIEQGALLNFEQVLVRSTKSEAKAAANESRTAGKTGRLSSCNVRLSFGDVDHGGTPREKRNTQRNSQESRRSGQQNQPLSRLSKYDRLLVDELSCFQELKKTSRTLQREDESRSRLTFGPGNLTESSPDVKFRIRKGNQGHANGSNEEDTDEFVAFRDSALVHGYGLDPKYQLIKQVHTKENPIVDVTWNVFQHHPRHVKPEHAAITPVMEPYPVFDSLCIAEKRKIHVHQKQGDHHSHATSFPIHGIFSSPLCLLVERDTKAASNLTSISGYPTVFSMTNPMDELSPVLFLGGSEQEMRLLLHPDSSVVGTAEELPLVLIFEPDKNIHSLWMARFTTAEEIEKAAEIPVKENKEGYHLHFHGNCESPRIRNQSKSASGLSARTANSTSQSNSIVTPPLRAILPGDSARKHSLHREVLLASGRKFPFPESASSWTPHSFVPGNGKFSSPLPAMNFSQSSPEPSGSSLTLPQQDSMKSTTTTSNLALSDMSISLTKNSSSAMQMSSIRSSMRSSHSASPNVPASALKDIRSTMRMFPHSKILTTELTNSVGHHTIFHSPTRRQLRSGSLHSLQSGQSSRRLARSTHPCHPVLPITDELAFPKIAMVHLWNDTAVAFRQKPIHESFLFVDCFEHTYFCFVSLAQHVLKCVLLKNNTDGGGLMAGGVVTLPANSAVCLPKRNAMLVLHPSKELRVYASPALMLYVVNMTSPSMDNIGEVTRNDGPTTSSPQVTKFVYQFWSPRFSPVQTVNNTPTNAHSAASEIISLVPCSGNKVIAKTSNGSSLLRLPHRPTTDMVELCLVALRTHSGPEFFGRFFVELSKNTCNSGRSSVSLQARWDLFFETLFGALGCTVSSSSGSGFIHGSKWDVLKNRISSETSGFKVAVDNINFSQGRAEAVLFALHLVYEETQLCEIWRRERRCMASWMSAFAEVCGLSKWTDYYEAETLEDQVAIARRIVVTSTSIKETKRLLSEPPSIVKFLEDSLTNVTTVKFPVARLTNPLSRKVILLTRILMTTSEENRMAKVRQFLEEEKFSMEDLRLLPLTLQVAIRNAFCSLCEHETFDKVPTLIYEIAGREDAVRCKKVLENDDAHNISLTEITRKALPNVTEAVEVPDVKKAPTGLPHSLITKRFAVDARVREAERLLTTSEPIPIPLNPMHYVNEVEFRKAQEGWLKSVVARTMSLPVARGMLSLRSEFAYATEKLSAPDMLFTGVERATGRKVTLKNEDLPSGHDFWPRFHNGVATGLQLCHYEQDNVKFDHHWLAFCTNQQTKRETVEYAGMFLGMALNGLIDVNTDPVELHNLLVRLEDSVSIAVILGMACVKRGTQDKRYFRMIGLHIISFVPDSGIELVIPPSIHVASLLSLGLLYMGSANRFVSERLLVEIWSGNVFADAEGNSREGSAERESASLAAAVGLGFVLLGMGNESGLGIADLRIPQRLRAYMVGGMHGKSTNPVRRADPTLSGVVPPTRGKDRDDQLINTHITAPGAILALAMIYMKTERADIAAWMDMPKTLQELDETRPDFLMLKVLARSLIMWNTVETNDKWINSNFPTWITKTVFLHTSDLERMGHDVISLTQAYFYILAGAGLTLGFRFAGTANEAARQLLTNIAHMLNRWTDDPTVYRRSSQGLIQTCLTNVLLAISMVMAGTGDLHVLRFLRFMHGRPRMSITYGHQMGVHMAIGLLFLGCGMQTLGTSNEAIAAMLIAFFPMWPKGPADNRYHLQAFRHLYVLAVENRLAITRSLHGGNSLQSTIRLLFNGDVDSLDLVIWKHELVSTPCVLPEFSELQEIRFASGKQWIKFHKGDNNWMELRTILQKGGVTVYPTPVYHDKHDIRFNEERGNNQAKDFIRWFGQNISRPVEKAENVLVAMRKFSKVHEAICADRGLAAIFQLARRTWFSDKTDNNWVGWIIYESVAREEPEALVEILAFSVESEKGYADVADMILRKVFQGSSDSFVWKKRLRKAHFAKVYNLLFLNNDVQPLA